MDSGKKQVLSHLANKLRLLSVQCTSDNPAGNSGHPTTCASCAEIMSYLFFHHMRYDKVEKRDAASDRFILSKGHAAPILYSTWVLLDDFKAAGGKLNLRELGPNQSELVNHLRETGHKFEGHPTPKLDFVDVATGSLGQGLGCGAGMAYVGKYIDKASYRVFTLLGDGECAEGAVYEAMAFASFYKLDNLVAIVDLNRLGQSQATMYQHDTDLVQKRWESFGWTALVLDGHDLDALDKALNTASPDKPLALICKTYKGKGFEGIEDLEGWHGKPLANPKKFIDALINSFPNEAIALPETPAVIKDCPAGRPEKITLAKPAIPAGTKKMATRKAYGASLAALDCDRVVSCDGDVKNSTFALDYKNVKPNAYVECFIAEQNLAGVAIGMACRDRVVSFASTFAAFFGRSYDHIRMGAISLTNANFVGSHCGVSIGADGPSQMALEDLAMFRAIPNCTVFYPSDAVSTSKAVELSANTKGICYIRTTRDETPVIYENFSEPFEVGTCHVLKHSADDKAVVISAGITLFEALKAYEKLAEEGIHIQVIDLFCIKPIDKKTIVAAAKACGGKVVTVEDHYPEGGIGEAVAGALIGETGVTQKLLAVRDIPCSGKGGELIDRFNIGCRSIIEAVKSF